MEDTDQRERAESRSSSVASCSDAGCSNLPWQSADSLLLGTILIVAIGTRTVHLGEPSGLIFAEHYYVGQALAYLRGEYFVPTHPPLVKLLIAASILIFGNHPFSWRIPSACCGIALVAITYLLGRRMFRSRIAGAFAASFVTFDGLYLVHSRIAELDIEYLCFAALAYLALFRFVEPDSARHRRGIMVAIGVLCGLCLSSKFLLPGVTFILVVAFMLWSVTTDGRHDGSITWPNRAQLRVPAGTVILTGSVSAIVYLAVYLPHYALGWWGGIGALFHYFGEVFWLQRTLVGMPDPKASPWWSWPLMLHGFEYLKETNQVGGIVEVWEGGNPILWWTSSVAVAITTWRAIPHPGFTRSFLIAGYFSYWILLAASPRLVYLYLFMPSAYFGFLCLADLMAELWRGELGRFEQGALLLTLAPVFILGLGPKTGLLGLGAIAAVHLMLWTNKYSGKISALTMSAAILVTFIYFFPIWTGTPVDSTALNNRMWLAGPGLIGWTR